VRIFLFLLILVLASQNAHGDQIENFTEYRCDQDSQVFEMANFYTADGYRYDPPKFPGTPDPIQKGEIITNGGKCELIGENPIAITISSRRTNGRVQGMCGALSGTLQHIITINDQYKIIWPSNYYRCFGDLPHGGPPEFKDQMRWPNYLKITPDYIFMLDISEHNQGITNFSFNTLENAFSTK